MRGIKNRRFPQIHPSKSVGMRQSRPGKSSSHRGPAGAKDQWNISFLTRMTATTRHRATDRATGNHQNWSRGIPPPMFMP